jgi:hypothetical protein
LIFQNALHFQFLCYDEVQHARRIHGHYSYGGQDLKATDRVGLLDKEYAVQPHVTALKVCHYFPQDMYEVWNKTIGSNILCSWKSWINNRILEIWRRKLNVWLTYTSSTWSRVSL